MGIFLLAQTVPPIYLYLHIFMPRKLMAISS